MNPDRKEFLLTTRVLPARLDSQEAAWFLGFAVHDIPILVNAHLLKPLGHPPPKGVRYFAAAYLLELREDTTWLSRATDAISKHWRKNNAPKQV